jgi:hypothetical protein
MNAMGIKKSILSSHDIFNTTDGSVNVGAATDSDAGIQLFQNGEGYDFYFDGKGDGSTAADVGNQASFTEVTGIKLVWDGEGYDFII